MRLWSQGMDTEVRLLRRNMFEPLRDSVSSSVKEELYNSDLIALLKVTELTRVKCSALSLAKNKQTRAR